jgi:hypothetical protein
MDAVAVELATIVLGITIFFLEIAWIVLVDAREEGV